MLTNINVVLYTSIIYFNLSNETVVHFAIKMRQSSFVRFTHFYYTYKVLTQQLKSYNLYNNANCTAFHLLKNHHAQFSVAPLGVNSTKLVFIPSR